MAKRQIRPGVAEDSIRASISFPKSHYEDLERIAAEKRVSLAWVVREAIEQYLIERWPLIQKRGEPQ